MNVAGLEVLVTSKGRLCTADAVAAMVVFLGAERASFVTGALIAMGGTQRRAIMDTNLELRLLSGGLTPFLHLA